MTREKYQRELTVNGNTVTMYDIGRIRDQGLGDVGRLPFSIRILLENLIRHTDGYVVTEEDVRNIASWQPKYDRPVEIPYHPERVLMQDFTGIPAVVDLASLRGAVAKQGGDPGLINPLNPVELIIDHSVQVDYFGCDDAMEQNVAKEYERNNERYALLKWAQKSFDNFAVVPPRSGICHQVNLEHLARVVMTAEKDGRVTAFPDTLVGTDSHTTMVDGLGVMGWGVGGIEAEAVMLGQPYYMVIPQVIGVRLSGKLAPGVTATDLVLRVTQMLREYKVVGKFVEFFGPGLADLSLPDRATIGNMTPEFGATLGFFPVDGRTIEYLNLTGRSDRAELAEAYCKANNLWYTENASPEYTDVLELDMATVEPSVSGPSRPQDRIAVRDLKKAVSDIIASSGGPRTVEIEINGQPARLSDGSIVVAAITSCTNTSNPTVLLGAGLLARNAVKLGLSVPPTVKTSLAPGSTVVPRYLDGAGLTPYLEALGFHLAAFGCTTCIGNTGPLIPAVDQAVTEHGLNVAAVLSGNRNFEARIHQHIKSNFLASPMLVVAYALAGRIDIDLTTEPLGHDPNGRPVFLKDVWPAAAEIDELIPQQVTRQAFKEEYGRIFDGDKLWQSLQGGQSLTFDWDPASTYIKDPPYFDGFSMHPPQPADISGARALALLGDTVTTDHISPAGAIPEEYPAGQYLMAQGVAPQDFNSYGSRRGNHEVMMRGTFGNVRLKNRLADGREGGYTRKLPQGDITFIYDAAMQYAEEDVPLIVLAGKEYGTGSSRDWAAKGTLLLGVRMVAAGSFERIHRGNLVGMGVLPVQFKDGETIDALGLSGTEVYSTSGISDLAPGSEITITAVKDDGSETVFTVIARLDTPVEVEVYKNGGILPYMLRKMMKR